MVRDPPLSHTQAILYPTADDAAFSAVNILSPVKTRGDSATVPFFKITPMVLTVQTHRPVQMGNDPVCSIRRRDCPRRSASTAQGVKNTQAGLHDMAAIVDKILFPAVIILMLSVQ